MFVVPVLQALFGGASFAALVRSAMSLAVVAIFFPIGINFVHAIFPSGFGSALPAALVVRFRLSVLLRAGDARSPRSTGCSFI